MNGAMVLPPIWSNKNPTYSWEIVWRAENMASSRSSILDEEAIFDELVNDATFVKEAVSVMDKITSGKSRLPNLSKKYSYLVR